MTRRCGVLGSPVGHSLSPVLHRAAYGALGLDWEYDAHEVDAEGLAAFLAGLGEEWRGLSLTMPLKQVAVGLCTSVTGPARQVGVVNTVLMEQGGGLLGLNTDIPGLVSAWTAAGLLATTARRPLRSATVIGAGATARSTVAALHDVGVGDVTFLVRSPERAAPVTALADGLGMHTHVVPATEPSAVPEVDLLVSTLPGAAFAGPLSEAVDLLVARSQAVSDVAYDPRPTPLVSAARAAGLPCAEGFDLLLQQAVLQVELMTGSTAAPLAAMRAAGMAALAGRETGSHP